MLTFNLKKEWFEKIKSGEKTHEYRVASEYWKKRLEYQAAGERIFCPQIADFVITKEKGIKLGSRFKFALGYPHKDDKNKILYARVKNITVKNGKDSDLKLDADVYDIEFELMEANND